MSAAAPAAPASDRMSLAAALAESLVATLSRPGWWFVALAGFMVRGGILLLLLPVVRLPTVAGLANDIGPLLIGFVFAGPTQAFVTVVGLAVVALIAWFVVGGYVGAWLELQLARATSQDDALEGLEPAAGGDPGRAFAVRALAHVPTAIVMAWGSVAIVAASYDELIHLGDQAIPIVLRVALRLPLLVGLLIAAWLAGEAIGGAAVRRLAWGASVPRALGQAVVAIIRPSGLAVLAVTSSLAALVVLGATAGIAITWQHLAIVLVDGRPIPEVLLALVIFGLTWTAGLWLVSLAVTWRSAAWTAEVGRHVAAGTMEPPRA